MKARLYLETTIPSYLTAWPSRDVVMAGHQQVTREWWERRRRDFTIYISTFVLDEAGDGDPAAAQRRLEVLRELPLLAATAPTLELAGRLVRDCRLPPRAAIDAVHIAIAAVHGMDYLLTWNCTHLANAEIIPKVRAVSENAGYVFPMICTPEELMGS
jgi:hypothetical protein